MIFDAIYFINLKKNAMKKSTFLSIIICTLVLSKALTTNLYGHTKNLELLKKTIVVSDTISPNGIVEIDNSKYKILYSSPGLSYTIRKRGNEGNSVSITRRGRILDPTKINIIQYDGGGVETKKGFENVNFPFSFKISTIVNYKDNFYAELNDFEIIIYEEGVWQITVD